MILVRVHPDLKRKIQEAAAAKDRTISWPVEHYVKLGLGMKESQ